MAWCPSSPSSNAVAKLCTPDTGTSTDGYTTTDGGTGSTAMTVRGTGPTRTGRGKVMSTANGGERGVQVGTLAGVAFLGGVAALVA
jgi:hypothetical protein